MAIHTSHGCASHETPNVCCFAHEIYILCPTPNTLCFRQRIIDCKDGKAWHIVQNEGPAGSITISGVDNSISNAHLVPCFWEPPNVRLICIWEVADYFSSTATVPMPSGILLCPQNTIALTSILHSANSFYIPRKVHHRDSSKVKTLTKIIYKTLLTKPGHLAPHREHDSKSYQVFT